MLYARYIKATGHVVTVASYDPGWPTDGTTDVLELGDGANCDAKHLMVQAGKLSNADAAEIASFDAAVTTAGLSEAV